MSKSNQTQKSKSAQNTSAPEEQKGSEKASSTQKAAEELAEDVKKKYNSNRTTPYDDTLREITQKRPWLIIPVINEVFGTDFPKNESIINLDNMMNEDDELFITDGQFLIRGTIYHSEYQSVDDKTIPARIGDYDMMIALRHAKLEGNNYTLQFPRSFVLYLRSNKARAKSYTLTLANADDAKLIRTISVACVADYTKENMFEKNLLLFLPFYILRYQNSAPKMENNPQKLQELLDDYNDIINRMDQLNNASLCVCLTHAILKVAKFALKNHKPIFERMETLMKGEKFRFWDEEIQENSNLEGKVEMGSMMGLTPEQIAYKLNISEQKVNAILEKAKRKAQIQAQEENLLRACC